LIPRVGFRPDICVRHAQGMPEDVSVIAWGLGLERPFMIKYQLTDIRKMCGHGQEIEMIRRNPICRLDS
jgi:phenylalanyl-tRNA synthetase alpha chain